MKCKAFAKLIPTIVCAPYVADFDPLKGFHESGGIRAAIAFLRWRMENHG